MDSSLEIESRPKVKIGHRGRKRASVHKIIAFEPPPETKYLINDLNIDNRNWVILNCSHAMVREFIDLGMSLIEPKDQACVSVEHILRND